MLALTNVKPRCRVIVDNDFGGDPDGLFQLAHHLLSPACDIRGVIASHHHAGNFYGSPGTSAHSAKVARELLDILDPDGRIPLIPGSEPPLTDPNSSADSDAARFIIDEALRDDTDLPLVLCCGAGLTDTAIALMREPRIAKRLRIVWIGGCEYDGLGIPSPNGPHPEYNFTIDSVAAQIVFQQPEGQLWQIPRNVYRQTLVSHAELLERIDPKGQLGGFLLTKLGNLIEAAGHSFGEAFALGDSPLVLLTALTSAWEPDPSSSEYITRPAPKLADDGRYLDHPDGRPIRVYHRVDNRLMFEDLYAKVARFDRQGHEVDEGNIAPPPHSTTN